LHRHDHLKIGGARIGKSARLSVEQADIEASFEGRNPLAHGALGEAEFRSGLPETPCARQYGKGAEQMGRWRVVANGH
jgi:hypothetical protein